MTLPPSLIATLPGASYIDEAQFAREQELIFERMWCCAARASDLPEPGAFRTVQVGRESVLLSRTRDRSIRAFLNVCRHRGARLCTDESGTVGRAFRCMYHAWTYDLDGRLIAAPNLVKMPDVVTEASAGTTSGSSVRQWGVDRAEFGLIGVHVREWLGYVWVCLADEPPSFEDDVLGAVVARLGNLEAIEHYGIDELAVGRRVVYDVAANWKLIVENFQECYHCATIHPELVEVLPEFTAGLAAQAYVGHGALFGERIEGFTVDGSPGLPRIPTVTAEQDRRYYALTILPQVFINLVPDHVILHRMYPMAVDRTIVECDWLFLPEVVAAGRDLDRSVELFHRVNVQDFEACERCQPAMGSRTYARGGVLVPSEHHLGAFHDWIRAVTPDPAAGQGPPSRSSRGDD